MMKRRQGLGLYDYRLSQHWYYLSHQKMKEQGHKGKAEGLNLRWAFQQREKDLDLFFDDLEEDE